MAEEIEVKEWTVMFYFASDNPLAPGIIAQMKSIKYAGFHPQANVIAQFDPNTEGTPTHIFDVNHINKLKRPGGRNIGFAGNDPFVRNMVEDKLWGDQKTRRGELIKDGIKKMLAKEHGIDYKAPVPPNDRSVTPVTASPGPTTPPDNSRELGPKKSLEEFLKFCSSNYPARHYMLFILGHGLVVGNDIFLFDEHAEEQFLSLKGLRDVLTTFKQEIELQAVERKDSAQFEFVGFHSCSVSSLEVAYELQGTANYMLASQGPAFVGSWPYRQILIRLFNDLVDKRAGIDVKEMLGTIFDYCLHNSADFLLAGHSFDLCLCDLNKVSDIKEPLEELSKALIHGLADPLAKDFILLSHWKSQSYWQETYTDLFDFCLCLSKCCENAGSPKSPMSEKLQAIHKASGKVMGQLEKGSDSFIVRAEFAGPASQYSHGLSIFFPWSEPSEDSDIMRQYQAYKFSLDFEHSWRDFLLEYFVRTMRDSRSEEDRERLPRAKVSEEKRVKEELEEDIASLIYNREGPLSVEGSLDVVKVNPIDGTGDDCNCGSIKNHPHDTRPRDQRGKQASDKTKLISDSENFFREF